MGETAEVVAKRYKISRRAQDGLAVASQQRTTRAQQQGLWSDEPAPIQVRRAVLDKKSGEKIGQEDHLVERDECDRPATTLEGLLRRRRRSTPRVGRAA